MRVRDAVRPSLLALVLAGCGADPHDARLDSAATPAAPPPLVQAWLPTANQLQQWQQQIDLFDGGYRPTGSPAHEAFIQWLGQELTAAGVSDVHTEPYSFTRWTPIKWSVELIGGPSPGTVAVSGYVPYSGATGAAGVQAPLVYLPLPPTPAAQSLDPAMLKTELAASLSSVGGVAGRIVLFHVPRATVPLAAITGPMLLVNDPAGTLGPATILSRNDLAAMLYVPAALDGHLPAITSQLTDYAMMRAQLAAFARMTLDLSAAPASELGVVP